MEKKKKNRRCPPYPLWMLTYSDLVTLLLTFFVFLFSMSTISPEKFAQFIRTLQIFWGIQPYKVEKPTGLENPPIEPLFKLYPRLEKWSAAEIAASKAVEVLEKGGIKVDFLVKEKEFVIRIPADNLFGEGQYIPNPKYLPLLKEVCKILKARNLDLRIEGHTDNRPIYKYPLIVDNWDLSLLRAITIVQYFLRWGYPKNKLSAAGYADTHPIASNKTPQGRAKNRRIEIVIKVGKEAY